MVRPPTTAVLIALGAAVASAGAGCTEHDIDPDLSVEVSERIPTVVVVEWELALPSAVGAYVEFGGGWSYDRRATAEIDGRTARAMLVGNKPCGTVGLRVIEIDGGVPHVGPRHTVRTGGLGPDLPQFDLEVRDRDRASGGFLVTPAIGRHATAMIIDADGDVVWAHRPAGDWDELTIVRVIRSQTGDRVIYLAGVGDGDGAAISGVERVAISVRLDGTDERLLRLPGAHHDLVERRDGRLVTLVEDVRVVGGRDIAGDALVEVDEGGDQRVVWSAWDHFSFDPDASYNAALGWTHANAVDVDRDAGRYLVSLHNLDSIVAIDADTGEQQWVLGGADSDYTTADGDTTLFERQHQLDLFREDRILVFDNGLADELDSRVVEYELDHRHGLATRRWEYHLDPEQLNVAYGDVQHLPADHVMVTWSALGQIDELTPDGELVWRLRSDLGDCFGYTLWRDTLYDTVFEF